MLNLHNRGTLVHHTLLGAGLADADLGTTAGSLLCLAVGVDGVALRSGETRALSRLTRLHGRGALGLAHNTLGRTLGGALGGALHHLTRGGTGHFIDYCFVLLLAISKVTSRQFPPFSNLPFSTLFPRRFPLLLVL